MQVECNSRQAELNCLQPAYRYGLLTLCVSLLLIGFSIRAAAQHPAQEPNPPSDSEQALFIKGQSLYNQNLYYEAIAVFGDFLRSYPQSQIKDMALLWLGRCQIRVGNVGAAEQIAVRLRELPETQFVDLYEEELRVARQSLRRTESPTKTESAKSDRTTPGAPPSSSEAVTPKAMASAKTSVTAKPAGQTEPISKPRVQNQTADTQSLIPKPIVSAPATSPGAPIRTTVAAAGSQPTVSIRQEQSPKESPINGVIFYRLVIVNEGPRTVKDLVLTEQLTDELQFASSDPAPAKQEMFGRSQRLTFRVTELKPGTSRILRIAVRLRNGTPSQSLPKTKHSVTYDDAGKTNAVSK